MQTNFLTPKYGYSDNGNKYQKCDIGKKVGTAIGAYGAVRGATRKVFMGAEGPVSLLGSMKEIVKSAATKGDKLRLGASMGVGLLIGSAIVVGVNRLIGGALDGIVNKVNAKKADKAAEAEKQKVEVTA